MGLKSSKKTDNKTSKSKSLEKTKRELSAIFIEVTNKRNKESRQKRKTTNNLCNQLRNVATKMSKVVLSGDTVLKEVKNDSNVKLETVKSEPISNAIEFNVESVNRFDSYVYGTPSSAVISYLEGMQIRSEEAFAFHLQEFAKDVRVDRKLLILNSDFLGSCLPPEMFTITIRGYSYESITAVLISLYTRKLYISLYTFNDVFRFCYELKITAILELLTNICDTCDPIFLLSELRKMIIKKEYGKQYTRLIYEICRNYYSILKHPSIVDLNFCEIKELVKPRDEIHKYLSLDPRCELQVYHAVIDWILYDQKTRLLNCLNLLRLVRFNKLQVEEWKRAFNPNLLQSFPEILRNLMLQINDTFGVEEINEKLNVFDIYSKLPKIKNVNEELQIVTKDKSERLKINFNEDKNKQSKENRKWKKTDQDEESEKMVKEALRCFKIIIGTQMLHDLPTEGKHSFNKDSFLLLFGGLQSQVPYKTEQGLFMHQLKPSDSVDSGNSAANIIWSPLSQRLPKTVAHFQALKIGSVVFIIGGIDVLSLLHEKTLNPVSDCCVYSLSNDDWYKVAPMKYPRGYHGSVWINDKIYVFGGISTRQSTNPTSNKTFLTNSFEVFDIRSNAWSELTPQDERPCPRMAFGMVYHQDVIWVIGGLTGSVEKSNYESGDLLSDVWIYSLKYKKWKSIEFWRLPKPRAFMTSVMFRNQIFVIGGHEVEENTENEQRTMRDLRTKSVMIFKDVNNAWEEGAALNLPRIFPAATVFNGTLFVIGGVTHDHKHIDEPVLRSFSGSYELYNPDINPNWVENSMVFSVHGGCAVTIFRS